MLGPPRLMAMATLIAVAGCVSACAMELETARADPAYTFSVDCEGAIDALQLREARLPQGWDWDRITRTDHPGWNGRFSLYVNDGAYAHFDLRCRPDAVEFMAEDAEAWRLGAERYWDYDAEQLGQDVRFERIEPGNRDFHPNRSATNRIIWRNGPFVAWIAAGDEIPEFEDLPRVARGIDALLP